MILNITNKCLMECSHCMNDCHPCGDDMSLETFEQALKFMYKLKPIPILVGGGEPTLHPNFIEITNRTMRMGYMHEVIITSNGMFLEDKQLFDKYMSLKFDFQITNDPRFYPRKIKKIEHKRIVYEDHLRALYPLGRSKNIEHNRKPQCYNLRIFMEQGLSFEEAVRAYEFTGKFCAPTILQNGNIVLGETVFCRPIGTVYDSFETLKENALKFKCNRCGTFDNLPELYKNQIMGEWKD